MAKMLGKAHRPMGCPYGCCVPDYGKNKAARRAVTRRAKRIEARNAAHDLTND